MADQPLGPVLHIIGKEAIVHPHKGFVAKGATVVTMKNEIVGSLDYPIARVDRPYQVIKLHKKAPKDLEGQLVIAKLRDQSDSKKKSKRRNQRK
ncbi:MAG: hypothetical protein ACXAE3_02205 [Candidatus Kariarchaeaceae archaeon]|jgi:rRNA processing protein Gar1